MMITPDGVGPFTVAIVGAGPAGIFAAKELANKGVQVLLFNRDMKVGGLAEYGIYPDKIKMKDGLRNQFRQILAHPNILYFGNVLVGNNADISIQDLIGTGVHAVLIAVGAQGTKWLGLPGEELQGVYHAKDLAYHYNGLSPYSQREYKIGKRVALVGVGNVMIDIARWLAYYKKVDEIIIIARRGPAETKFDRDQLEYVMSNIDIDDLEKELVRVSQAMWGVGQDPDVTRSKLFSAYDKADPNPTDTRIRIRFLKSPTEILGNDSNNVRSLVLENNSLELQNAVVSYKGMGVYSAIDVDTVIFAIGNEVDRNIGLPVKGSEFVKAATPRYPVDGNSFEVFDPQSGKIIEKIFLAGWSRKANVGLVGLARKDGVNSAQAITQYLASIDSPVPFQMEKVRNLLATLSDPVIYKEELLKLETFLIPQNSFSL
jgi:ferredoxin--NADP+ reductase